jgi:hypothetical protein
MFEMSELVQAGVLEDVFLCGQACPRGQQGIIPYRVDRGDDKPLSFGVVYWLVSACVGVGWFA